MKLIPLTQGKFAQVDDEDYEWLMQWKWHYHKGYAKRNSLDKKTVFMHREIMKTPKDMYTDHRNENGEVGGLNNQKYNLRDCTYEQNRINSRIRSDNSSGYKGVSWIKAQEKWLSYINLRGKRVRLGYFYDPVEAAKAYDKAAKEMHGEFARLNFPSQTEVR